MIFGSIFSLTTNAFEPDHYLSYRIKSAAIRSNKIRLQDQFIDWTDFVVSKPSQLLNPTLKRHDNKVHEIKNPRLHYADYRLRYEQDINVSANVIAINQFGTFNLKEFRPHSVLVPTEKRTFSWFGDDAKDVPGDHYLCYAIPPITVENEFGFLKDQFRSRVFEKLTATRFCNPAAKIHDGKRYDIENKEEENHLMCFDIGPRRILKVVQLLNQFGNKKALVVRDHELCVPTIKIHLPTECKGSFPDEQGVCNGDCPNPTDTCQPTATGPCECRPAQPVPCSDSTPDGEGMCNGECTAPNTVCLPDSTLTKCNCVPDLPLECADTLPNADGVCGGFCPSGENCVVNADDRCECQPEVRLCGRQDDGQCGGECPTAADVCVNNPLNDECFCQPSITLCADSQPDPQGFCGGICPAGEACVVNADDRCQCEPEVRLCGRQDDGQCGGECPTAADICVNDPVTNDCLCTPQIILCTDSLPDPQGVCGGACPVGETCAINADERCECQPEVRFCGRQEDGVCGGECPVATDICIASAIDDSCLCIPNISQQCSDNIPDPNGVCGGECPTGQRCAANANNACECLPTTNLCSLQDNGQCGGDCPVAGDVCQADTANNCFCAPKAPVLCIDTLPDPAGVCGGECPLGEKCVANDDNRCECQSEPQACGFQSNGECGGFCPDPSSTCLNDIDGNCSCIAIEPIFCADSLPDADGICGGICPQGEKCVINLDQGCECRPQNATCERLDDGQCGGTCSSVVEICTNVPGTNDCGCIIGIDIPTR